MELKLWIQLVDERGEVLADTSEVSVSLDDTKNIEDLRDMMYALYDQSRPPGTNLLAHIASDRLRIYADRSVFVAKQHLSSRCLLKDLDAGKTLIVKVPEPYPPSVSPSALLPPACALPNPMAFAGECSGLTEWSVNEVHKVPLISTFMENVGGCTKYGQVFWRLEDKQAVSVIVDGWFRESTSESGQVDIVVSAGVYLVLERKKNVLVCRRLEKFDQSDCLLYMGYEAGQVVFSSMPASENVAMTIYENLREHSDIWLLIDGFPFDKIPRGPLQIFKLLVTSQQVNLNSQQTVDAYCCLLPCWTRKDLVSMGKLIHNFSDEDIDKRYYYSGGSVREFTLDTSDEIVEAMQAAISQVPNPSAFLTKEDIVLSGTSQVDRLRHTFVQDANNLKHFTARFYWNQVIDSEYAIRILSARFRAEELYNWT